MTENFTETRFTVTIFGASKQKPVIIENNSITHFTFIEDVFNALPLAILEFVDRSGLIEAVPIIGREMVSIMYGDDTVSNKSSSVHKTWNFFTYDINFKTEITNTGSGVTTVIMKLVDPRYVTMNFTRFSRSWKNKTGSEIIKSICTYMVGGGQDATFDKWEDSFGYIGPYIDVDKNIQSFIMPYWTPLETIRWLLKRMEGNNQFPGYLFYTSGKGFNLVTFARLIDISKNSVESKKYFFMTSNKDMYFSENRILNWKLYPPSNSALSYIPGGTCMSPRFDTKEMRERSRLLSETYEEYKNIVHGSQPLYPTDINNATSTVLSYGGDYVVLNCIFGNEWIKKYMNQLQMQVLVKGRPDRYAGMLIDIEWPALKSSMQNEMYNGRYLVKSIEHIFEPAAQPQYKQMIRILKTGYKDTVAGGALGQ